MKRTLSDEQLRASTEIPFDANSSDDSFQDPPVEQTQSEPALFNRTAANSPMEMVDEVNRPSTPANTHSAPEKSVRSTSASSAATIATSDDEISSLKKAAEQITSQLVVDEVTITARDRIDRVDVRVSLKRVQ